MEFSSKKPAAKKASPKSPKQPAMPKGIASGVKQLGLLPVNYSVGQLTALLKQTLTQDPVLGGTLTVEGELSNVKRSSRGHLYFTLKDPQASLSGVMWASTLAKLPFEPEEGQAVLATGMLDLYAPSGSYSLVCRQLQPVGIGALQLAYQQLKTKLDEEGLFSPSDKRPLPDFPLRIGMVTSPTGAVLHDMMRVIRRKNALVEVVLAPAKVQGEGAAQSIVAALEALQALPEENAVELILLARGGGSFEDLFCFSEEAVVRAVVACNVPVVAGIGHEPDFSLADAAADLTASTPTAAAELAVPDCSELAAQIEATGEWLLEQMAHQVLLHEQAIEQTTQTLQHAVERRLEQESQTLQHLSQTLATQAGQAVAFYTQTLAAKALELDALSPLKTLERGYCVATDLTTHLPVTGLAQLKTGQSLSLQWLDGQATTQVLAIKPQPPPKKTL